MGTRIGIDLHVIDGKYQGSRTHVIEVFSRVIDMAPQYEFYLFLDNPKALASLNESFTRPNVKAVRMPRANPVKRLCFQLPSLQRRLGLDILHVQYIMPVPSLCTVVSTIHDILFESHPQFFTRAFRIRSKLLMRQTATNAAQILTVSEFSKKELISRYGVDSSKIQVITNAVNKQRFFAGVAGQDTIARRGLASGGYILTVGRLEPRKNHLNLLRAYSKLGDDAPVLVIAGQPDYSYRNIFDETESLGLKGRVKFLDDVGDDELPALYRHAALFAYPSWAEGFGLPVLEAMASGVPVVTSNATALSEIATGAALLVDPGNIVQISEAMNEALKSARRREELSGCGLSRAGEYSWERAAEVTIRSYEAALSKSR